MKRLPGMVACLVSAVAAISFPTCKGDGGGGPTAGGESGATATGGTTGGSGSETTRTGGPLGTGGSTSGTRTAMEGGSGGTAPTGSSGGATNDGQASSTGGGQAGAGGETGTGGITRTGGTTGSGGGTRTGGNQGTGGATPTGGSQASTGGGGAGGTTLTGGLTLYYVRHAEVIANVVDPSEITLENADTLTDLGVRQVAALTTYLQGLGTPDAILVSPHLRAQRTVGPYLTAANLTGEVWMELAEASDKPATGAPVPSEPKYIRFYKATLEIPNLVFRDPAQIEFWQNDNYESGLLMVMTARDLLLERYGQSGKTVLVVGHAIAGQLLIGLLRGDDLLNGPPATGPSAVFILNTGVMKLSQDPATGLFRLDGRNVNNPPTQ